MLNSVSSMVYRCDEQHYQGREMIDTTNAATTLNQDDSLKSQIHEPKLEIEVLTQLFDLIDYPLMLTKTDGSLVWTNRQGSQTLSIGTHLMIQDKRVVPSQANSLKRWRERLDAATKGEEALMLLDDGNLGQAISINPLSSSKQTKAGSNDSHYGLLVIILGKNRPCEPLTLRRFSGSFRLTPAEQRIVAQLMAGLAPGSIAMNNSVAVTTVRTQIKSVLAKTGISNMRGLMLKLSQLPPVSMAR